MKKTLKLNAHGKTLDFQIILIGLILVTLVVNPGIYDPVNTPKFFTLISLSVFLIGLVISKWKLRNKHFEQVNWLFAIFNTGLIISFLFTDNKNIGFFGDFQRRNGFVTYLSLSIIWLTLINFSDSSQYKKLFKLALSIGTFFCIYGYIQHLGKDIFSWTNPYNPVILTLGNPNFSSALLGVLSILLLGYFFERSNAIYKIFIFLIIFALIYVIYLTNSRQGLLLTLIGFAFFVLFSFWKEKGIIRFGLTALIGFALILLVLSLFRLGPLASIIYKESISVRGYYWRAAIKMFEANPLVGIGLDRYLFNFKEFREPGYVLNYGYNISSSNAHNVYLQFLATGGLSLTIPYLIIIVFTAYRGLLMIRNLPQSSERYLQISVFSAWIGFQAQSIISIDNIGIAIWGWVLSGVVIGYSYSNSLSEEDNFRLLKIWSKKNLSGGIFGFILTIPIFLFCSIWASAERNMYFFNGVATNDQVNLIKIGDKIVTNRFKDAYLSIAVAKKYIDANLTNSAIPILENLSNKDPKDAESRLFLAYAYQISNKIDRSIQIREEIAILDPFHAPNLYELANLYKSKGDIAKMKITVNRILQFAQGTEIATEALKL